MDVPEQKGNMYGKRKDLLGLRNMSAADIRCVLTGADTMKFALRQPLKRTPHLTGKSIVEIFMGESIRTKLSFELAAKYMSGTLSAVAVPPTSSRERLLDIAHTIDRMGTDLIIIRHKMSGVADLIARNVKAAVINAGDGMNEQPTQALVDIYTIREHFGDKFEGLKVAIVGDVLHSAQARSCIWGLTRLGAKVCVGGPATLIPPGLERFGVLVYHTAHEAVTDADVVMSLRLKTEGAKGIMYPDAREYAKFFGIDEKCLSLAKKNVLVMNALPVRRGVEMMSGVISTHSTMLDNHITNGIAIKMSVLFMYAKRGGIFGREDSAADSAETREDTEDRRDRDGEVPLFEHPHTDRGIDDEETDRGWLFTRRPGSHDRRSWRFGKEGGRDGHSDN